MSTSEVVNYLRDLVTLLLEEMKEARAARNRLPELERDRKSFETGRAFAFAESLSLVRNQADAFGIPLDEIGLTDFDEDKEMVA